MILSFIVKDNFQDSEHQFYSQGFYSKTLTMDKSTCKFKLKPTLHCVWKWERKNECRFTDLLLQFAGYLYNYERLYYIIQMKCSWCHLLFHDVMSWSVCDTLWSLIHVLITLWSMKQVFDQICVPPWSFMIYHDPLWSTMIHDTCLDSSWCHVSKCFMMSFLKCFIMSYLKCFMFHILTPFLPFLFCQTASSVLDNMFRIGFTSYQQPVYWFIWQFWSIPKKMTSPFYHID